MVKSLFISILTILLNLFCVASAQEFIVMDMVHHNPGEAQTQTAFRKPEKLASYGFNAMVINEFKFPQCAVSFDKFDKRIFPKGSEERKWIENLRKEINAQIDDCHAKGLKCYYFTDIIVLPKRLVELYKNDICDENGTISFEKPMTWKIHQAMMDELFRIFPQMDGLVIRTGETYTHNIPYHQGNNPVNYQKKYKQSKDIHSQLINFLRENVCVKYNKTLIYRTWDFGNFHTNPEYYTEVTNRVAPHKNLYFAIKHTNGDYFRTYPFNKTLSIGRHKQIVEVQCQREYEGKGAYPNYIANAVINGFEETKNDTTANCLADIKTTEQFSGVWTWSRGGGWRGPYIKNELWCDLNTYVMSKWAQNPDHPESEIFDEYSDMIGITEPTKGYFRRMCMLSPDAIIRGRGSLIHDVNVIWSRDDVLGGTAELEKVFDKIVADDMVEPALYEIKTSVAIWKDMVELADKVECTDKRTEAFIRYSSRYGLLLYSITEQGWNVILRGYQYDKNGTLDRAALKEAIAKYDSLWEQYRALNSEYDQNSSLYVDRYPGKWVWRNPTTTYGMGLSVDNYRKLIK